MIQKHGIQCPGLMVFISLLLNLLIVPFCFAQKASHEPDSVLIEVDINKEVGPLEPIWAQQGSVVRRCILQVVQSRRVNIEIGTGGRSFDGYHGNLSGCSRYHLSAGI